MVADPAATPVTTPVEASTVATVASDDVHVPPVVADANCVVKPEHTFVAPVIAATVGNGLTVTVVDTDEVQPLPLVTVYVMVVVPAATPVTTPFASIVAVAVFALDHTPPAVVLDNVVVEPAQTDVVPVIEATTGKLLIVTVVVTELVHPLELV